MLWFNHDINQIIKLRLSPSGHALLLIASSLLIDALMPTTFMPGSPATFNISMFVWIKQFNQFFAFGCLILILNT